MAYERDPGIAGQQGEYYGARDPADTGRTSRTDHYSSARDYAAAGQYDRDRSQNRDDNRERALRDYGRSNYQERGQQGYGQQDYDRQNQRYAQPDYGEQNHGSDGQRLYTRDAGFGQQDDRSRGQQGYGRQPQGYHYDERGFINRAGDEVRSWFGDEDAERRRELDQRYDERLSNNPGGSRHDDDYHQWRRGQIEALDRDYHEYRQENRSKFENEFSSWRTERQTQRGSLSQVQEHQEVVGSDGEHIGTVDKVRGDRIILTKNDVDAGGRHHSIPSRWIDQVDDKVKVRKTAAEAKAHWRDEERNQAFFNEDGSHKDEKQDGSNGPHVLNRSFSGTY